MQVWRIISTLFTGLNLLKEFEIFKDNRKGKLLIRTVKHIVARAESVRKKKEMMK